MLANLGSSNTALPLTRPHGARICILLATDRMSVVRVILGLQVKAEGGKIVPRSR